MKPVTEMCAERMLHDIFSEMQLSTLLPMGAEFAGLAAYAADTWPGCSSFSNCYIFGGSSAVPRVPHPWNQKGTPQLLVLLRFSLTQSNFIDTTATPQFIGVPQGSKSLTSWYMLLGSVASLQMTVQTRSMKDSISAPSPTIL
mgnify:CR=1 FL=1